MNAQIKSTNLGSKEVIPTNWTQRLGLFILFLICELAIVLFGSNYFDVFQTNKNLAYQATLSVAFLVAAMWLKRSERLNRYWQIVFALFIVSFVITTTSLIGSWNTALLNWLNVPADTSQRQAVGKIYEMLMVVVPILVLTKLSGADLGTIFIKRGDLKMGLGIGALVFVFLGTASFMFAATRFSSTKLLGDAVVWGLVFSIANGFLEELWLRGIFLKRLVPLVGVGGSVLLTALVFGLMHGFAFYFDPIALIFYMLNTVALGLACGYLMMKSDSIWGAMVIHAASDFFLFIAVLANA
jgi:membrane protease YdiL (CAAX protease family)